MSRIFRGMVYDLSVINSDGYSADYYDFFRASSDEIKINPIVYQFLNSLPGVDVEDYQGQVLK